MYGNVGEIYQRPAVMLWFLLNSESYCRMFVCTDRNEKWRGGRRERGTERERERERLPVLNYSRMRTSQKQSWWIFRIYRKLLLVGVMCEINLKISIKYGFNDWFWLLRLRQLVSPCWDWWHCSCGQCGNHWETKERDDTCRCVLCKGVHRGQISGSRQAAVTLL